MPRLISLQLLHVVKVLRDWYIISVDESWTLQHMFRDSWTLDTGFDFKKKRCALLDFLISLDQKLHGLKQKYTQRAGRSYNDLICASTL